MRSSRCTRSGGETEWADLRAAWDALPEKLKRLVEGRTARHLAYDAVRRDLRRTTTLERQAA